MQSHTKETERCHQQLSDSRSQRKQIVSKNLTKTETRTETKKQKIADPKKRWKRINTNKFSIASQYYVSFCNETSTQIINAFWSILSLIAISLCYHIEEQEVYSLGSSETFIYKNHVSCISICLLFFLEGARGRALYLAKHIFPHAIHAIRRLIFPRKKRSKN